MPSGPWSGVTLTPPHIRSMLMDMGPTAPCIAPLDVQLTPVHHRRDFGEVPPSPPQWGPECCSAAPAPRGG